MKKCAFLVLLIILCITNVYAFESKVYDFGAILTNNEEKKLNESINKYVEKNDVSVAIITLKHTNYDTQTYVDKFISKYGVSNDAVFMIYNVENNNYNIHTFGNKDKYYNKKSINGFIKEVSGNTNYYLVFNKFLKNNKNYSMLTFKDILLALLLSIAFTFITVSIIMPKNRLVKREECATLNIKYIEERFVRTNTDAIFMSKKTK